MSIALHCPPANSQNHLEKPAFLDHFVGKSLGFPYPPGDQRAKMAEIAEKEMVTRSEHTAPWQPLETLEALGSWGSVAMGTCRFLGEWGVPPPNFGCLICLKMGTC